MYIGHASRRSGRYGRRGACCAAATLSATELTDACLARIGRAQRRRADLRGRARGHQCLGTPVCRPRPRGRPGRRRAAGRAGDAPLLCGIPLGLKDLYGIAGPPAHRLQPRCSRATSRAPTPPCGRACATRGWCCSATPIPTSSPPAAPPTRSATRGRLDRVVGGSSGGSAAALAAGMIPAALGSDTCGSLRIPSSCCGTSAIKPTHGRLSLDGIIPLAPSLDHPGPMARTIADCAALLAAMAAADHRSTPRCRRRRHWASWRGAHRAARGRWRA